MIPPFAHRISIKGMLLSAVLAMSGVAQAEAGPDLAPTLFTRAEDYSLYVNERYGYEISYPSFFLAGGVSDSGDGQVFTAPKGDAELRVFAHACVDEQESVGQYLKSYRKKEADGKLVVTYRHKSKGTAVVSGHAGKRVFYRKLIIEGGWCTEFSFKYDHAQKVDYDAITAKIAASFKPQYSMPVLDGRGRVPVAGARTHSR